MIYYGLPEFYYQSSLDEAAYSHTHSNRLNVRRMLDGKPAWQRPFERGIVKQKTLVLEPDVFELSEGDFAEKMYLLDNAGFEIYCYAGHERIQKIAHQERSWESIYRDYHRNPRPYKLPAGYSLRSCAATQLAIPADQIAIIDLDTAEVIDGSDIDQWLDNYTEYESTDSEIKFETETESTPDGFVTTRFRQYLRKESDIRFTITLDTANKDEEFKKFYESTYQKVS